MSRRSSVCGPVLVALLAAGCGGLGDYSKYLDSGEPDEEAPSGSSGGSAGASDTGFIGGSGGGSGSGSGSGDGGDTTGGSVGDDGSADGDDDGTTGPITIAVNSVTPDYGTTSGGDTVVIDGGPFDDSTQVFIGRTAATVLSHTESTITVATPSMTAAGSVAVEVESDAGSGVQRSAFTYWVDGTGQYGMIGYVEVARYTGSYWTPSVPADEYFAQVYFTDPTTYRWYDLVAPALDTCRSETWTSSPSITVFTAGVPQIYLRPTSGSTLELNLDGFAYLADPSSLTTGARYTLLAPSGGDLPNVDVADIVQLPSSGPTVTSPSLSGSTPPFISQYETFRWTPGGADWVELSMILENGYTTDGYEVVTCAVYDDGSFTFDGSQFASWPSNAQAIISVGFVYDQSTTLLPWNRSTSAVAGVTKTVGGAFTY